MTALARIIALSCFLLTAAPASAGDPHPPQLNVSFLAPPAPIVQNGATRLVYEMLITNFSRAAYVVNSIEAKADGTQSKFADATLAPMITHLGVPTQPRGAAVRSIDADHSAIVFFILDLGKNEAPNAIEHTLRVLDDKGGTHEVRLAPLSVSQQTAIVVAPPLRGEWIAGDSVNNGPDAAHRSSDRRRTRGSDLFPSRNLIGPEGGV